MRHMLLTCAVLTLLGGATSLSAQDRTITGRVLSPQGQPLSSATIEVVGTARGALSGVDGTFSLSAPAGPVSLRVTLLGYKTTSAELSAGQSSVEITLDVDVLEVEGIVVTGRATSVSNRNVANSVSTVSASQLDRAPAETIEKQIQGKVAGAIIDANGGAPGGGMQVRLRGASTIIGLSEPLYVIDGVVVSNAAISSGAEALTSAAGGQATGRDQDQPVNRIADLNPADIETIEILKGASAAAIYGSKASNGVILITTKKGTVGRPEFRFAQRFGTFDLARKLGSRVFETQDEALAAFGQVGADNFNGGQRFDLEEQLAGRNDLSTESVFSVRGGTETTRYFVSGLWKNDEGIIEGTGHEKQSIRLNLDQQLSDRLNLGVQSYLMHSSTGRGFTGNDNAGTSYFLVLASTPSFARLQPGADGLYPVNPFERSNPLATAAQTLNDEDVWRFIAGSSLDLDIFDGASTNLRFRANGGVDFFRQKNSIFAPPELQFEDDDGLLGTAVLGDADNLNVNVGANLILGWNPSDMDLNSTTTFSVQWEDQDLNRSSIVSRNLVAGQPQIDAGTAPSLLQTREKVRDWGFGVQEEVLLQDERLFLTAGIRADRSSTNTRVDEFHWYPKAAASYRFIEPAGFLSELKLRAAFGQSGNRPLFPQKFTPLTTGNISGLPGLTVPVIGTTGAGGLKPERQTEFEAGIDASLFDGRAELQTTVFQKTINDLLLNRTLAGSSGFANEFFNGGELRVRGFEVALGVTPVQAADVLWITRGTFYMDRNEITSLPVPSFRIPGSGFGGLGTFQAEEGVSATRIFGPIGNDENGDNILATVGDVNPDFRVGFTNDVSVGPVSLFVNLDWQQGGEVVNLHNLLFDFAGNAPDHEVEVDPVTVPGTAEPIGGTLGVQRLARFNAGDVTPYIEDATFLKLRELSLSYSVPETVLSSLFGTAIRRAHLTASARDLWTWQEYSGYSPEVSNFGNQPIGRNIDVTPFPPSRSFWLSVDVTF